MLPPARVVPNPQAKYKSEVDPSGGYETASRNFVHAGQKWACRRIGYQRGHFPRVFQSSGWHRAIVTRQLRHNALDALLVVVRQKQHRSIEMLVVDQLVERNDLHVCSEFGVVPEAAMEIWRLRPASGAHMGRTKKNFRTVSASERLLGSSSSEGVYHMTSETRLGDGEEQYATSQEALTAIKHFQNTDYTKLMLIARSFAIRLRGTVADPEDLVHEAIAKTLDGRRRWKRSVSILKHLDRVMESDSGHMAEKRAAHSTSQFLEGQAEPAARLPDPETRLTALDELDDLLALFTKDQTALELLRLKGDGFPASEIQRELGMGKTQYDTVTKRIRRRLAKHQSEGGQ